MSAASHGAVLRLVTMTPKDLLGHRTDRQMLGATCIGGGCAECASHCLGEIPVQRIIAPLLGSAQDDFGEAWQNFAVCRSGDRDGIRYRVGDGVLYGVIEIDEAGFAGDAEAGALQRATREAYRRIFDLLDAEERPHLWRVWNYLADINAETGGLERYRQFNVGRHDAFVAAGRLADGVPQSVPAACALGVRNGPLTIAFMAGRMPAQSLENPRQIAAWRYPQDYGPRSPTFARGALAALPGQDLLFISGTASIVVHCTVHAGNVLAQAGEALVNIEAVLGEANRFMRGQPLALADLAYRIYLRDAGDYAAVRDLLRARLGGATALYVQADICRSDLLVEIEATASRPIAEAA